MAKAGPRAMSGTSGTAGRSAETRAALVAGAISALVDVGFAGASAREIAGRAGCAVRQALAGSPLALLIPPKEAAHAVVAGFLGLELLANLDGDRTAALALFDRARTLAALLDVVGTADLFGATPVPLPTAAAPTDNE